MFLFHYSDVVCAWTFGRCCCLMLPLALGRLGSTPAESVIFRAFSYILPHSQLVAKKSLEILCRLCDDSTQPSYGFVSISLSIIRTIIAYNVNTYAVAHSHLRCLNNRTENRRQSYRTARVANVNQASETSAYIYDGTCTFNS